MDTECTLELREFGEAPEDLAIDFDEVDRVSLVSRLLQSCASIVDAPLTFEHCERWTVGHRIELLLRLVVRCGQNEVPCVAHCEKCDEKMEFSLPLEVVANSRPRSRKSEGGQERIEVELAGRSIFVRLPNGSDQRRWAESGSANEPEGEDLLAPLLSLVVEGRESLQPSSFRSWLTAIEEELSGADPLVDFYVRTPCPACTTQNALPMDLQELGLECLRSRQDRRLWEVHRLASRYHWTESEILALPAWRRERYLAWVEDGEARYGATGG